MLKFLHMVMPHSDSPLLQQLSANSEPYRDPLTALPWHALNLNDFWLPPGALSLSGDPLFEQQPLALQRRLSHYEFANFIQAGIWLEGIFIERMGKALKRSAGLAEYAYTLHEIREEAGHSLMFLKLAQHSGLNLPRQSVRRPWLADFLGRHAPARSLLYRLAVVIGEDIPDRLNRCVRADAAAINPLVREMCRLHIIDEARHLARARDALDIRQNQSPQRPYHVYNPLLRILVAQFVRRFYVPNAQIYELAGLTPGRTWRARARANPVRKIFLTQTLQPTFNLLARHGIHIPMPRF